MRRTGLAIVAVAVGLIAVVAVAFALTPGEAMTVGENSFVNREGIIDVSNSPTMAYNPARPGNVITTYRKDRPGYGGFIGYSFDSGATWEQAVLPVPAGTSGCTASQGELCPFGPDATFGPDGTLYVTYVNLQGNGNRPDNLWLSTSTDGGRTLSLPTKITGALAFMARVTVDPKGPVYITWLQADEVGLFRFAGKPPKILVARSDDGGHTFAPPVTASDAQRERIEAPSPVIDASGQLVIMYEDLKANRRDYEYAPGPAAELPFALVLTRSTDGGRTFTPGAEFETDILATRRFLPFLPELPQLAASPSGKLYATWADGRGGDDDVYLRSSADGGRTWAPPVKVNNNGPDGTAQFLPKIDIGPGERVSIVFLDGRNDPGAKKKLDAYLATSTDGGKSFTNVRLSTKSFDDDIGPTFGVEYGIDFGTRLGLAHGGGKLYAAWVDTSAGSTATGRQDVNSATVTLPTEGPRTLVLGVIAVVLLGLGAAGLLRARSGRGTPSTRTDAQNRQVVTS